MASFIAKYLPNVAADPQSFVTATGQTLYMTLWTSLIAGLIGLLVGGAPGSDPAWWAVSRQALLPVPG